MALCISFIDSGNLKYQAVTLPLNKHYFLGNITTH